MSSTPYQYKTSTLFKAARAENDLLADDRLNELLKTYHVIHIHDDEKYSEKLTWCLEHCQNKFRDLSDQNGRAWYFKNDQDAAMFALRWA